MGGAYYRVLVEVDVIGATFGLDLLHHGTLGADGHTGLAVVKEKGDEDAVWWTEATSEIVHFSTHHELRKGDSLEWEVTRGRRKRCRGRRREEGRRVGLTSVISSKPARSSSRVPEIIIYEREVRVRDTA